MRADPKSECVPKICGITRAYTCTSSAVYVEDGTHYRLKWTTDDIKRYEITMCDAKSIN